MKTKMILCLCPSWGLEMPPIALGVLKTALKSQGIDLKTRDLNLETYLGLSANSNRDVYWDKSNLNYWTDSKLYAEEMFPSLDPLLERFSDELAYGPHEYIAFSIMSSTVIFTNQLVERIRLKTPDKVIIAGGPCLAFHEERQRLRTDFDYFVVGEGEETLAELYAYLECERKSLPKSVYQTRRLGEDLPFRKMEDEARYGVPDYSDMKLPLYQVSALPIIFTRSCLFKCRFCADYKSMGDFRKTSSQRMYENLKSFLDMGYRSFWFNDLLINGIMSELVDVCLKLESESYKFEWIALATPNRQLKIEDLLILARNGLKTLNFGLESGSPKVMRLMHKGFNLELAEEGLKRVRDAGINTQLNIIVGFPGETEEDFCSTLEFLSRNRHNICGFTSVNACVLLAGSDISRRPEKYGIRWDENQDMQTQWYIPGENSPEIRMNRLKRVLEWIEANGYNIYSNNQKSS
ncbi:MAG: B12-binding domain-containing radical SAM protein [Candidatus Cloacimonetes bacterium]|nr:B12-binding domain-containing radical SAM protein [Candidatus Cloacimonadota bacterium]